MSTVQQFVVTHEHIDKRAGLLIAPRITATSIQTKVVVFMTRPWPSDTELSHPAHDGRFRPPAVEKWRVGELAHGAQQS